MSKYIIQVLFYFLTCSFALSSAFAQTGPLVSPKFSVDVGGKHSVSTSSASGQLSVNTGFSVGFEILTNSGSNFNFGGGLMYLIPREQEIKGSGGFNFIPVYAVGILDLVREARIIPSLIFSIGYNVIYNGDSNYKGPMNLSGGLYLGGGVRLSPGNFFFEALFKSFNGSAAYQTINLDITYTTFSIGFGVTI